MSTPRVLSIAFAAALFVWAAPSVAHAQIPGGGGGGGGGGVPGGPGGGGGGSGGGGSGAAGMPSKQEIEKRIKDYLDSLPDRTAEMGRIKVIYKPVPSDPVEIVKASGQLPAGVDPEKAAKQYLPLARPYVEKAMGEIGKLIADIEFKWKSTKFVPAEYVFGVVVDGPEMTPVAIRLAGKSLKAPVVIPLKATPATQPYASLTVEVKAGKKEGEFSIEVGFGKVLAIASKLELKK